MNIKDLAKPFPEVDLEWRMQRSGIKNGKPWGMVLTYVTARAIQDRLDEVCGPENWCNEFKAGPDGGILCGISIFIGDRWVTKWNGASNTDIEAIKGGLSSATKRAGVEWGIGRYLYKIEAGFAKFDDNGAYSAKIKENGQPSWHQWNPPQLPSWALPEGTMDKTYAETTERLLGPQMLEAEPITDIDKQITNMQQATTPEELRNIFGTHYKTFKKDVDTQNRLVVAYEACKEVFKQKTVNEKVDEVIDKLAGELF